MSETPAVSGHLGSFETNLNQTGSNELNNNIQKDPPPHWNTY